MEDEIRLPKPNLTSRKSLEETISQRRSVRNYQSKPLTIEEISQILWAAQGITKRNSGFRAAPSAGALYPIEIYLLNKEGLFNYLVEEHSLKRVASYDLRKELTRACLVQNFIAQAPISIVICALFERITPRYGQRGVRYTYVETGHIAQNIHLQAVSLGLSSVPVGAFDDEAVKNALRLPENQQVLYIIPLGYAK